MSEPAYCKVPEPLEFLAAFGVEPKGAAPDEGFWRYEFEDETGLELEFSVNWLDRSVFARLHRGELDESRVYAEGAAEVTIKKEDGRHFVQVDCRSDGFSGVLIATIFPRLSLSWGSSNRADGVAHLLALRLPAGNND